MKESYGGEGLASYTGPGSPVYVAQNVGYAYSDRGRFTSLASTLPSVSNQWNYSYLDNSDLISGWSNGIMGTVKCFETNRNLITELRHMADGTMISQFDYQNDGLGRRTRRLDTGSVVATNLFAYDSLSQLTNAVMQTNLFAWVLDPIGNRVSNTRNAVTHGYSVNALNQYEQITNGGVRNLSYDWDGNLTNDSVFAYVWDGENRLVGANGDEFEAHYSYDYMSRRVEKTANGVTNQFIYDGWNLIAETTSSGVTNIYVWGLDLSGALQGAGGISGLLAVNRNGQTYYPVADANGNITDYVDANGTLVAHREFDAYGNTLAATGPMINDFNFWFSSKYLEHETGLYYYGYRYYSPVIERWLNLDPIGEEGGLALYMFCKNSSINYYDEQGLAAKTIYAYKEISRILPQNVTITISLSISKDSFVRSSGLGAVYAIMYTFLTKGEVAYCDCDKKVKVVPTKFRATDELKSGEVGTDLVPLLFIPTAPQPSIDPNVPTKLRQLIVNSLANGLGSRISEKIGGPTALMVGLIAEDGNDVLHKLINLMPKTLGEMEMVDVVFVACP